MSALLQNAVFERLLACWFNAKGLALHQIASFDKFLQQKLEEIVTENSQITVENDKTGSSLVLSFVRVYLRQPALREADGSYHRITPHECRLRGLSYNVSVYVNVIQEQRDGRDQPTSQKLFSEVLLCRIPCMVGCMACSLRFGDIGECALDPGGYFIVNGNEKSALLSSLRAHAQHANGHPPCGCAAAVARTTRTEAQVRRRCPTAAS